MHCAETSPMQARRSSGSAAFVRHVATGSGASWAADGVAQAVIVAKANSRTKVRIMMLPIRRDQS